MQIIEDPKITKNYEMCKFCGGSCCKRNACDCSPKDFDNDINKMREALLTGNYTIDFSRQDADAFIIEFNQIYLDVNMVKRIPSQFFYLRPRNVGRPIVDIIHKEEVEGPCIFWSQEKGCALTYEERPKGGRTLIPMLGPGKIPLCVGQYEKREMIADWKPYTDALVSLAKEFFDPNWKVYKEYNFSIK